VSVSLLWRSYICPSGFPLRPVTRPVRSASNNAHLFQRRWSHVEQLELPVPLHLAINPCLFTALPLSHPLLVHLERRCGPRPTSSSQSIRTSFMNASAPAATKISSALLHAVSTGTPDEHRVVLEAQVQPGVQALELKQAQLDFPVARPVRPSAPGRGKQPGRDGLRARRPVGVPTAIAWRTALAAAAGAHRGPPASPRRSQLFRERTRTAGPDLCGRRCRFWETMARPARGLSSANRRPVGAP
jgi:hypothetical protein